MNNIMSGMYKKITHIHYTTKVQVVTSFNGHYRSKCPTIKNCPQRRNVQFPTPTPCTELAKLKFHLCMIQRAL